MFGVVFVVINRHCVCVGPFMGGVGLPVVTLVMKRRERHFRGTLTNLRVIWPENQVDQI